MGSAYHSSLPSDFSDSYSANGLDRYLTAVRQPTAYDARGNMTGALGRTYAYGVGDRLKQVVSGGATTRFLTAGSQAIGEYDGAGALLRRYVPGAPEDEVLVWFEGSGTASAARRFLHREERGSVIAISDDSGDADLDDAAPQAASVNLYDLAYGASNPSGAASYSRAKCFRYAGQIWIEGLQLYYFRARACEPVTGCFLQTDPIGLAGGLNLCAYVQNDPVNFVDPTSSARAFRA